MVCIIYFSRKQRLNIDEIYHANRIISIYFQFREIHDRETLLEIYNNKTLQIEERASDDPFEMRVDLKAEENGLLSELFSRTVSITDASGYVFYEYDRFRNQLTPSIWSEDASRPSVIGLPGNSPYHSALDTMIEQDIWHPRKQRNDIEELSSRGRPDAAQKRQVALHEAEKLNTLQPIGESAAWLAPVVQGRVIVGLIEFYSHDISRLAPDVSALRSAAYSAGEALRRIELANDRGWLAKMSYVHAARHSIENIRRRLEGMDAELAADLMSSFQTDDENFFDPPETNKSINGKEVQRVLRQRLSAHQNDQTTEAQLQKVCNELENVHFPSSQVANTVVDVFETIFSNSKHSPLQLDCLSVSVKQIESSALTQIEVLYLPQQVRVPQREAHQIFVSPIRAHQSPTYHYGLFLCGAQVRMLGGCASFIEIDDLGLGNARFGIGFAIPISTGAE